MKDSGSVVIKKMASTEKELKDQLIKAGKKLLKPPPSVDELLPLLDQVESFLSRVEQSPSKSMQNAISPLMKALVANELLRHSDMDVKVSIASCISEITRITAPEAPYDDEKMKEIFQLIVAAFEKLFETSDRSYSKRVSILETVAKVRSCVVMLDLECDLLILEMFQHFLNGIRDVHPESVVASMETIMSLVLEESEDISPEILSPLLTSVKKENQDVLPITRKLAEKVLENCTSKLKPYLMQTVESMGMSLNDYSKVVSFICQETSDKAEHNDVDVSEEHTANGSKTADDEPQVTKEMEIEEACPGEVDPLVNESPKLVTSNGVSKTEDDNSVVGLTSPEKKPKFSCRTTNSSKAESHSMDTKAMQSETKPDRATKKERVCRKPNSLMQSIEASAYPWIDSDKEDSELLDGGNSHSKETSNSLPEGPSVGEPTGHSGHGKETPAKLSSPTVSHDDTVKIASPSRSQSIFDGIRSKRGRGGTNKKGNINTDTDLGSPSEPKGALLRDQVEDEAPPSADIILKNECVGNSDSEARPSKRSGKKTLSEKANEDKSAPQTAVISRDSGPQSDSEEKPLKHSVKKVDTSDTEDESSVKKLGGRTKKARGKTISQKGVIGELSSKSTPKLIIKNQGLVEETPKTQSKRKCTPAKAFKEPSSPKEFDEKLVGSRIKVWWPKDHAYYEGVVESFDPVKKKHKVLYVDGDVETLNLSRQRWEFVVGNSEPDEGQATDLPSEEQIDKKPPKKKVKTKSDSSTKPVKTDASSIRGKGTSTNKSNVEGTNSSDKLEDDDKLSSKIEEIIRKTARKPKSESAGKLEENTTKTGSKSKEGATKMGSKSKDDTSKTSTKSKEESAGKSDENTAKTGSKSKNATLNLRSKSKDDSPKTITKSKDESAGKSEENTTKTKTGSKSKKATLSLSSKSKDDAPKNSTNSKDESDSESEENITKTKSGSKSKDVGAKLGSKSKDESAGKSKENTPKTSSKLRDGTPKLGIKTKDDDTPKATTRSKRESTKIDKKPPGTNGNSSKQKSGSSKVQENEDLGKEKLMDSAKASQQESETKRGKKRWRRVNG